MKQEDIEKLFKSSAVECYCGSDIIDLKHFTQAINQCELELYRELEKKLKDISSDASYDWDIANNVWEYYNEIQNKIKEFSK